MDGYTVLRFETDGYIIPPKVLRFTMEVTNGGGVGLGYDHKHESHASRDVIQAPKCWEIAMSDHHFWLSEAQFARLKPLLPNKPRGVPRVDDRRVISGIVHVIRGGLMWRDVPTVYGPPKTLYNRFIRWSRIGVFDRIFATLAGESAATDTVMIDATHLKAHRTAASLLKKALFPAASVEPRAA